MSWQGVVRLGAGWLARGLEAYGCIHLRAFGDGGEASHFWNAGAKRGTIVNRENPGSSHPAESLSR
ncbi:hypothetical protein NOLU111490_17170 [Novosphingobium lubricantis]|uniref:hypothetical protein n=1 Tax=Novosphingobium sp. CCH12-A3 TaxID=1768752 RepID=UPI000AAA73E3|nr:hypothetical protein [Novosphingobium sp. CCH12-A3]